LKGNPPPSEANLEATKFLVKEKGERVSNLKANQDDKEEIVATVYELRKFKNQLLKMQGSRLKPGIPQKDGKIDFSQTSSLTKHS
jgi:asparaginyl-tRNA synthetase